MKENFMIKQLDGKQHRFFVKECRLLSLESSETMCEAFLIKNPMPAEGNGEERRTLFVLSIKKSTLDECVDESLRF